MEETACATHGGTCFLCNSKTDLVAHTGYYHYEMLDESEASCAPPAYRVPGDVSKADREYQGWAAAVGDLTVRATVTYEDEPASSTRTEVTFYDGLDSIRHLTNFGRSVLGCIEAYDSENRRAFQHFSKSTRCAFLCTTRNSIFCKKSSLFSTHCAIHRCKTRLHDEFFDEF